MRGEEGRAGTGYAHRGADGLDIGPTSMGDLCMRRTGCGLNPMRSICDLWAGTAMKRAFAHALLTAGSTQPTHAVRNERHRGAHHSEGVTPEVARGECSGRRIDRRLLHIRRRRRCGQRDPEHGAPGGREKRGGGPHHSRGLGRALVSGWLSALHHAKSGETGDNRRPFLVAAPKSVAPKSSLQTAFGPPWPPTPPWTPARARWRAERWLSGRHPGGSLTTHTLPPLNTYNTQKENV